MATPQSTPVPEPMPEDEYIHPLDAHVKREPMTKSLVRVLVHGFMSGDERAQLVANSVTKHLGNRAGKVVISHRTLREAILEALADCDEGLLLITNASEIWSKDHVSTLLNGIDKSDHLLGHRRNVGNGVGSWFARLHWRILFALPIHDFHSPCRIHRVEALRKIPLQSDSSLLYIEILAKATFLGHLIGEENVPELPEQDLGPISIQELRRLLKKPTFVDVPQLLAGSNPDSGNDTTEVELCAEYPSSITAIAVDAPGLEETLPDLGHG